MLQSIIRRSAFAAALALITSVALAQPIITPSSRPNVTNSTGTLTVAHGGTGATTAAAARTALGAGTGSGSVTSVTCNGVAITTSGTCSTTGQVPGTATNDDASAGKAGEFLSSTVLSGAAVSLTTATAADITTISLTAGDWDVNGSVCYSLGGTTTVSSLSSWASATSATLPTDPNSGGTTKNHLNGAAPGTVTLCSGIGPMRFSIASTTTVYLSARATFGVSTLSAFGYIRARRVR